MSRHDQPGARPVMPGQPSGAPLQAGPRWYRARIRVFGPVLGLVPMALIGGIAWIALQASDARWSGLVGLVGGVTAAPGLLVAGAPFADASNYPIAILASIPLWLLLGLVASRRSTRAAIASWRDYWRELVWLTTSVLVGACGALIVATNLLGESLLF